MTDRVLPDEVELGVQRCCRVCVEWWPLTSEFYRWRIDTRLPAGGYRDRSCRACLPRWVVGRGAASRRAHVVRPFVSETERWERRRVQWAEAQRRHRGQLPGTIGSGAPSTRTPHAPPMCPQTCGEQSRIVGNFVGIVLPGRGETPDTGGGQANPIPEVSAMLSHLSASGV